MLVAGILAGYFMLERLAWMAGIAWFIVVGILARTIAGSNKFIFACLGFLVLGFVLFSCNYIESEAELVNLETTERIEGNAISYTMKEDKIYFILEDAQCEIDGKCISIGRVRASCSSELVETPTEYIGKRLVVNGKLSRPERAANPACFDYRIYLKSKSIYYLFRGYNIEKSYLVNSLRMRYIRHMVGLRDGFLNIFEDEETRGFVKGVIFGDKSELDDESREIFNINGTAHILAVSGLHVGFLYSLIRFLSGRKRNKKTVVLTICILLLYGEMTMWSASTVRATLVVSMSMLSRHVKRPFDLLTSVSTAAMLILVNNPYQLFNTGFQLSFMALISIAFLCKPLSIMLGERLAVMLAVQIGILPISAFLFNRLNLLSMFFNIPIIALSSIIVPFYLLMLLVFIITGKVPSVTIIVAEGLERMMLWINKLFAGDGGFSSRVISTFPALIMVFYLIILFISSEWFRVKFFRKEWRELVKSSTCIVMLSILLFVCTFNRLIDDNIVFVSVGQGSCIHLRTPGGRNILIDGGGNEEYNVGEKILQPYLLKNGITHIDLAMATHLDKDHYKGLEELIALRMIDQMITNRDGYAAGDVIYEEPGFRITVLAPTSRKHTSDTRNNSSYESTTEENENSLVFRIDYDNYSLIATGDIGKSTEQEIIEYWARNSHSINLPEGYKSAVDADILAVPHHGSKNSSSDEFIDAVSPHIAVIQVGKNNIYGHPAPETLDRYGSHGIDIYRNDIQGAVGVDTDMKIDVMQ